MIFVDIESYSELDIREVGAYRYWEHPSTVILVICWAEDKRPVQRWTWLDDTGPPVFRGVDLVAHNAEFERAAFARYALAEDCTWHDTAAQAAMCALPRGLDRVGSALGLPIQKNKRGSYLISRLSKPQRPSKQKPYTLPHERWDNYVVLLSEFTDYCATDVEVCREVYFLLPKLPPTEQRIFDLTMRINERGLCIDHEAVRAATAFVERVTGNRGDIIRSITGFSHTQVGELLNWVNERLDRPIESLDKATVSSTLRRKSLPPEVRTALEIRQELAKSSTAKLDSILLRANDDGRVRGTIVYHTAGTGRWGGAGIQPQNFPQSKGKDLDDCIAAIHASDAEWISMVWGQDVPAFVSQSLRGMIVAAPGHTLVGGDFKSIEARVVLWLACDPGLQLFADGADIYVEMAKDIDPQDPNRQLGKQAVLGCGFGMGPPKFLDTCTKYDIVIDFDLAKTAVYAYRTRFFKVPRLWRALETAAVAAVKNPGTAFATDPTHFVSIQYKVEGDFLVCTLPSGRRLYYPNPELEPGMYGEQLTYMGIDSKTKAWRREHTYGGKLTENVVQAIARDLMALALLRLEAAGYPVVMTVHDEAVCEVEMPGIPQDIELVEHLMNELPEWARGLPVETEGFMGRRYS